VEGAVTPLVPPPEPYVTVIVCPTVSARELMLIVLPVNVGTTPELPPI